MGNVGWLWSVVSYSSFCVLKVQKPLTLNQPTNYEQLTKNLTFLILTFVLSSKGPYLSHLTKTCDLNEFYEHLFTH